MPPLGLVVCGSLPTDEHKGFIGLGLGFGFVCGGGDGGGCGIRRAEADGDEDANPGAGGGRVESIRGSLLPSWRGWFSDLHVPAVMRGGGGVGPDTCLGLFPLRAVHGVPAPREVLLSEKMTDATVLPSRAGAPVTDS